MKVSVSQLSKKVCYLSTCWCEDYRIFFSFVKRLTTQLCYLLYAFLSISLFMFRNLSLKPDLFMISLLNVLVIKGAWLVWFARFFLSECVFLKSYIHSFLIEIRRNIIELFKFWQMFLKIFYNRIVGKLLNFLLVITHDLCLQ